MIDIRPETAADAGSIREVADAAFRQTAEGLLIGALRESGDLVLSLVATDGAAIVGHIAFSRITVEGETPFAAVALAPLGVHPDHWDKGIGGRLVLAAHDVLAARGERLSVVVGDPDYYSRFGYRRDLAEGFESGYQSDFLLAVAFADGVPSTGILRYASAFADM